MQVCAEPGCPKLTAETYCADHKRVRPGRAMPTDWPATRRRIVARDKGICHLCGKPGAKSVDHVKPASRGGTDADSNLKAAHWHCNQRKGNRAMS